MVTSAAFFSLGRSPTPIESSSVEFGQWLPDLAERDSPGAVEALNVIPAEGSYVPFPAHVPGPTFSEKVLGALVAFTASGEPRLYAAGVSGVGIRLGDAFSSRYDTSSLGLSSSDYWQLLTFGDNIVALHPQLTPHAGEVGGALAFSPLGGSPPTARCGARVGDFLVLGNLTTDPDDLTSTGPFPRRVRWSGFNNIDSPWVTDPATQADFNDMPAEGGAVVGITGREFGTIWQERNISRMTYVGLPTVFDIETVEADRGALNGGCLIDIGTGVFFIANDGFFLWNGTNSVPIGDNKVTRYFFQKVNYAERKRILGAVDYYHGCVMWAFPVGYATDLTEIIIYSYRMGWWAHAEISVDYLLSGASIAASLDSFVGSDLDTAFPMSLDALAGGRPSLAAFDTLHRYGLFEGSPLAATLDTAEASGPSGERWFVNGVRPLVDLTTAVATVQTIRRDQLLGGALIYDAAVSQEITGVCPVLADARYMRLRVNIPAGASWKHARGVEIFRKKTGGV